MMMIMLMVIKMTACILNDEEPAPSVRSCILLLHRNHRAPSNLCHSEPSSFLYLTSIKLKHASVQELRNHYRTIKSNKVAPCKSTRQGRAPPWQHRPSQNIENLKLKKINIDVKIRFNPRLGRLTWMQSLCPMSPFLCSFGKPLVREAKSSPDKDLLINIIFPFTEKSIVMGKSPVPHYCQTWEEKTAPEHVESLLWMTALSNVDRRPAYLLLKELSSLQVHSDFAIKIHLNINHEPPTYKQNQLIWATEIDTKRSTEGQ